MLRAFPLWRIAILALGTVAATESFPVTRVAVQNDGLPDPQVARNTSNAIKIFNSIHSAGRQWGSSLHHNGLSFFPVTVPEGNVFYHGDDTPERPSTFEWLAFEIEHAANFAFSWTPCPPESQEYRQDRGLHTLRKESLHGRVPVSPERRKQEDDLDHSVQYHLGPPEKDDKKPPGRDLPDPDQWVRGYLQTYRATRDLNLIYVDGQSAAKANFGPMDSQDFILLDWPIDPDHLPERPGEFEIQRATELCTLAREWGIDGWVRTEAGFEIIYCDFAPGAGLELISAVGSPFQNETSGYPDRCGRGDHANGDLPTVPSEVGGAMAVRVFAWLRAAAERYHGHLRGRLEIDWSGTVSAFAFGGGINTTNPDPGRSELPRIVSSSRDARLAVRDRLGDVVRARAGRAQEAVDWQSVVDSIVSRYSSRLAALAAPDAMSASAMRTELSMLLNPFMDFPADDDPSDAFGPALDRCAGHYLEIALARRASWTLEDGVIYAALKSVSESLCRGLLVTRKVLLASEEIQSGDGHVASAARAVVQKLMDELQWSTWKDCGGCPQTSMICFVPMFPFGVAEDYHSPRCKNGSEIGIGYWLTKLSL